MKFDILNKRSKKKIGTLELTKDSLTVEADDKVIDYFRQHSKTKLTIGVTKAMKDGTLSYNLQEYKKEDAGFPLVYAEFINQRSTKYILVAPTPNE